MRNECIVCGSDTAYQLYAGILKCPACHYVFADLRLTDEELFALYQKDYFFGDEYSNYLTDKDVLQKNFRLRMRVLRRFLDAARHRHLLEIGSAYGFFLDFVRDRFDTAQGIDITDHGVHYACEQLHLDVVHGDFLQCDWGDQKFDVVCMWDTIEHLRSPHLYLKKISEHVERGALLAITTGDIDSVNARVKGASWRLLHPPTHAHYFSKKTLARMLDNYGFDVIYNQYCGFYRSVDNIAHNILVLRNKARWLYDWLGKLRVMRFHFYLNLYDIMYVIAAKR